MKILEWIFEPFTKPRYALTFVDGIKMLIIAIVFIGIILGIYVCYYYLKLALRRYRMRRICKKYEKQSKKD